ncbi:energy transducer TonB [Adhaeribacter pallidiroseus]|nr:energy transducer TonB [Adhaeribacter pallidiroseus]
MENLKTKAGKPVYAFTEKPAWFTGGLNGLKDYLEKNSRFTIGTGQNSFDTNEIVVIIINDTGEVEDVRIEISQGEQADAAAIIVLKAMPKWNPAQQNKKKVAAALPLFLKFK